MRLEAADPARFRLSVLSSSGFVPSFVRLFFFLFFFRLFVLSDGH